METIPSLWAETQRWLAANPQHIASHNLLPAFVKEGRDGEQLYTSCHMWSNFEVRVRVCEGEGVVGVRTPVLYTSETWAPPRCLLQIGRLSFFRSPQYRSFFSHLDKAGGFFYER